ncbi:MAG: OmpA family protein [Phycisphaerales bacterium]|jgi:chemotaxis protein MotB|nr:OmpA family protein [Phycisphaerales bacterium]
MTMRRMITGACAVVALGASMLGGCASQEVSQLQSANRSLTSRNQELTQQLEECRSSSGILSQQTVENERLIASLRQTNQQLQQQLGMSEEQMRRFGDRLQGLALAPLDPETDRALQELARKYPNLIQYDAARGMLRFASDLTFGSGSADVSSEAASSLRALADVLKGSSAQSYEIQIVGYTDAQPISSGTAQRHPTNMHLSCHRAISVRQVLGNAGVAWDKMMAAGWGENHPIAPSGPRGNTPANRRVEIYLTRSSGGYASTGSGSAYTSVDPSSEGGPSRQLDVTK